MNRNNYFLALLIVLYLLYQIFARLRTLSTEVGGYFSTEVRVVYFGDTWVTQDSHIYPWGPGIVIKIIPFHN